MENKKKASKEEAEALTGELKAVIGDPEHSWWTVGTKVREVIATLAYEALGYFSIEDWRKEHIKLSRAKLHRAVREVTYLKDVPRESVAVIVEGNAYRLTRLKPADGTSEEWLEKARTLSIRDFRIAVEEKRIEYGFPPPEKFCDPFPRMPESFQPIYEAVEPRLAATLGIDIEAQPELRFKVIEALFAGLMISGDAVLAELLADYENTPEEEETPA